MNSLMNADIMKRHVQDMKTFGYPYNEGSRRLLNEQQFGEKEEPHDEAL